MGIACQRSLVFLVFVSFVAVIVAFMTMLSMVMLFMFGGRRRMMAVPMREFLLLGDRHLGDGLPVRGFAAHFFFAVD